MINNKISLQQSKYYFASNFTWWIFHLMFPLTDALEEQLDDDLLEKLDAFYDFEEVAELYYGQTGKPGLVFVNEEKIESIYGCVIQYEGEIQRMMDAVTKFAERNKDGSHRFVFYAQCRLLRKIIGQHEDFVRSLHVAEYEEIYLANKGVVTEFLGWLDNTTAELKTDLGETYDAELDELLDKLAEEWVSLIEKAAEKHLSE
jgi:hypothetical protein